MRTLTRAIRRSLGAGFICASLLAGVAGFAGPLAAQSPIAPPAVRFYGHVTVQGGRQLPISSKIAANVNGQRCDATVIFPRPGLPNGINGSFTDNNSNYALDVQSAPGCTTPGASVDFSSGALKAQQHGTIPDLPGTAVHLDLTFQLPPTPTPAAAPRPAPAPAPRPAPPPAFTAPLRPAGQGPAGAQGPRGIQGPSKAQGPWKGPAAVKGPYRAQGPARAQAPAYGAGGGAVTAAAPRLPSTGTGGLLDQPVGTPFTAPWSLAAVLLAAVALGVGGVAASKHVM